MGGNSNVVVMFRKKQTKVLRVKDGKKRLSNASYIWFSGELTYFDEILRFLKDDLNLESVRILDGPTIYNPPNPEYCDEFDSYFCDNEIVDILIPKETNLDGWTLQPSRYV